MFPQWNMEMDYSCMGDSMDHCFGEKDLERFSILIHHTIPNVLRITGQIFDLQHDNDSKHCFKFSLAQRKAKCFENYVLANPVSRSSFYWTGMGWARLTILKYVAVPCWHAWKKFSYFQKLTQICTAVIKARGGYLDETHSYNLYCYITPQNQSVPFVSSISNIFW